MRATGALGYDITARYDAPLQRLGARRGGGVPEREQLRAAAAEFEALLTEQLVSSMRKTVPESVFFNTPGVKLFNEMLDGEYVRLMTDRGGIGLRGLLEEGFARAQGLPPGRQ